MAYPSYPQLLGSRQIKLGGHKMERSQSGKPKIRVQYSQTRHEFEVVHELKTADKDALIAYYEANKHLAFDFTWAGDGQTYSCRFVDVPQDEPITGVYFSVTVRLVVV